MAVKVLSESGEGRKSRSVEKELVVVEMEKKLNEELVTGKKEGRRFVNKDGKKELQYRRGRLFCTMKVYVFDGRFVFESYFVLLTILSKLYV